jgi:maltose O-acetyltransferase
MSSDPVPSTSIASTVGKGLGVVCSRFLRKHSQQPWSRAVSGSLALGGRDRLSWARTLIWERTRRPLRPRIRALGPALRSVRHNLHGRHVSVRANVSRTAVLSGKDIWIGPYTYVGPHCYFEAAYGAAIRVGSSADIGPGCMLLTITHEIGRTERRAGNGIAGDVVIGSGTWLGANVTALPGTVLGGGCVVGACSLLDKEYGRDILVAGVPARVVRSLS